MLRQLVALAGPDTTVIVVSDHGFHSDHLRPTFTPGVPAGITVWHRMQGMLAASGPGLLAEATRIHSDGEDRVLGRPSRFGLGFQLPSPDRPLGPHAAAFGHYGYGGLLGLADPVAGVSFAFLTSRPGSRWRTPRTNALVEAVYASLGA